MLTGAKSSSLEALAGDQAQDSTPAFSPPAQNGALPETSETKAPESLSFLQQTTTSEGAEQPTEASAGMGAFEQGPEVADVPPKEVVPATAGGHEGMSFMQTSELAGPEGHAPAVQEHTSEESADDSYVKVGAAEDGPGVGMTTGPGSEDQSQNAVAPSVAQLDAQTVSIIPHYFNPIHMLNMTAFYSSLASNQDRSTGPTRKILTTSRKPSACPVPPKRLWLRLLLLPPLKILPQHHRALRHPLPRKPRAMFRLLRRLREASEAGEGVEDLEAASEADPVEDSDETVMVPLSATIATTTTPVNRPSHRKDKMTMDSRLPADDDPVLMVLLPDKEVPSAAEVEDSQAGLVEPVKVGEEEEDLLGVEVDVSGHMIFMP